MFYYHLINKFVLKFSIWIIISPREKRNFDIWLNGVKTYQKFILPGEKIKKISFLYSKYIFWKDFNLFNKRIDISFF